MGHPAGVVENCLVGENPQTFGGRSVRNEVFCVSSKGDAQEGKTEFF